MTPSRIEENAQLIQLDESDMEALEDISKTKGLKRFVYPEFGVSLPFGRQSKLRSLKCFR